MDIVRELFSREYHNKQYTLYSVIDGAALPALLGKLEEFKPEYTCLFRGELPFDLAEAAPYLIKLEARSGFTKWLLKEAIKTPCCVFLYTDNKNFINVRKHTRSFLKVESPDGEILHFRYYDPRVMSVYLPTCSEEDNKLLYANIIESFLVFDTKKQKLKEFLNPLKNFLIK